MTVARKPQAWQVVTATSDRAIAEGLAHSAVAARLAASAQIDGPITSTYWWNNSQVTAGEWRITFQTSPTRFEQLRSWIVEHHNYEVAQVVATEVVAGDQTYLDWVQAEAET